MKNYIKIPLAFIVLSIAFFSCKNDTKSTTIADAEKETVKPKNILFIAVDD